MLSLLHGPRAKEDSGNHPEYTSANEHAKDYSNGHKDSLAQHRDSPPDGAALAGHCFPRSS